MRLDAVVEFIEKTIEAENLSNFYQRSLATRLTALHRTIKPAGQDPAKDLCHFVFEYIRLVPRLVSCIDDCARSSGTFSFLQTSIELIYRILTQSTAMRDQAATTQNLFASAYHCHRFIEELYENNRSLRNSRILESAVTEANLLAHHLVGEEVATGIDESAMAAFHHLVNMPDYYHVDFGNFLQHLKDKECSRLREDWNSLLVKHDISFGFSML